MIRFFILVFLSGMGMSLSGQNYYLDASKISDQVMAGHLKMGNSGESDRKIEVNNRYLTLGGKPIIPVMGEMHYSRIERDRWEDVILKMKANGINIIASYVIWNHHEELEGQFDWTGNKDLRSFIKLVQKHGLWVYPRIGPWCHGEVRNGGTPDWILEKNYLADRSNHPAYQAYVDRWYRQIARQMNGLYYKDGGPVVGVQLENEYWRGKGGEAHILWLKETARKYGMDVPLYTITGWRNTSLPQDEVIPLWGGYPAVPWATHIQTITENLNYIFEAPVNMENIGNEETAFNGYQPDYSRYPYFTCELGVGNQISYHRRPVIGSLDGLAIATIKTGSGSNMPGYYVFAGGSNPLGILNTLQEEQYYTGYWNEYPKVSYDFQAAIRETGELAPSYHQVKKLHYFLNAFGQRLAPLSPVIPTGNNAREALQYAIRSDGLTGFLFGVNYYRGIPKPVQKNVQFHIRLKNETLIFPERPVDIGDNTIFIWPFNFKMDNVLLKYATAQPVGKFERADERVWIFFQNNNIVPELAFDESTVKEVSTQWGKMDKRNGMLVVKDFQPGKKHWIDVKDRKDNGFKILILSEEEAGQMWVLNRRDRSHFFLSDANLYLDQNRLHAFDTDTCFQVLGLNSEMQPLSSGNGRVKPVSEGLFNGFRICVPGKELKVNYQCEEIFDRSDWLKATPNDFSGKKQLYHKIFIKEFALMNSSSVQSAVLKLFTDVPLRLNVNNRWVSQRVDTGMVNFIDLSGYVQKGENVLMLDVPYVAGDGALAARLDVEYFNGDKIAIVTDGSWLTTTDYRIPVPGRPIRGLKAPELTKPRSVEMDRAGRPITYRLTIPEEYNDELANTFLRIRYAGDRAEARIGHRLVADNFNNGTPWSISLRKLGSLPETEPLVITIEPLAPGGKIYFEKPLLEAHKGVAQLLSVDLERELNYDFELK